MEKLCEVEEKLVDLIYDRISDLDSVNTHELGEVIDIIKDIEEAKYYKVCREKYASEIKEEPIQTTSA